MAGGIFRSDCRGATIVEFAILSVPFFLLLTAIFQMGFLFFEQELFQTAISDAGRLILTGQNNDSGTTQAQFQQQVCAELPALIPCSSVTVDVRTYDSFSAANTYKPVDSKGNFDATKAAYDTGSAKTIVVVTGFVLQPILFPMMGPFFSSGGSGYSLLQASAAFRNEPWRQ